MKPLTRDQKLEQLRLQRTAERRAWDNATRCKVYDAFCGLWSGGKVWSKKRATSVIKRHFKVGDAVSIGPFGATFIGPLCGIVIGVKDQFVDVAVVDKVSGGLEWRAFKAQAWDLRKMKEVNE